MEQYQDILRKSPLFQGMTDSERLQALSAWKARVQKAPKGAVLLLAGQTITEIGILLEGRAQIIREEYTGERHILADLVPGELFAEAFACASLDPEEENPIPVTVVTALESTVLWIPCRRAVMMNTEGDITQGKLVGNLMRVLADKNLLLNRKIGYLSQRSTREKLLAYLSDQAVLQGKREFCIPFNRQELADYLCVERSAMSATLGKLRDEGILTFQKNVFRLL